MDEGTARLTAADLIGCRAVAGMTTAAAVEAFVSTWIAMFRPLMPVESGGSGPRGSALSLWAHQNDYVLSSLGEDAYRSRSKGKRCR